MPTTNQINQARERGQAADALMEDALVGTQQQAPIAPPQAQNTQAMANIFVQAYGDQAAAAASVQPTATIDSRTGQQPTNTSDAPTQRVITDSHGRVQQQRNTTSSATSRRAPANRRRRATNNRRNTGPGRGRGGEDDDIPSDVEREMAQAEAEYQSLETRIENDTREVLRSRLANGARDTYDAYNIRLMLWLFDHDHHDLFQPELLLLMQAAHLRDTTRLTKQGSPCKLRDFLREECRTALNNIDPTDPLTHPIKLESLSFELLTAYFYTFKKTYTRTVVGGEEVIVPGRGDDESNNIDVCLKPLRRRLWSYKNCARQD
jgi:hypothetical protein